jgi:elongation factor G
MAEEAKAAHEALVELVAEGDDELMQEFFEKGTLPPEDLPANQNGRHRKLKMSRLR